jgi:hypothetical protein
MMQRALAFVAASGRALAVGTAMICGAACASAPTSEPRPVVPRSAAPRASASPPDCGSHSQPETVDDHPGPYDERFRVLNEQMIREAGPLTPISAAELVADPARYDSALVEIDDDYRRGFEGSYFGAANAVWVSFAPGADVRCERPRPSCGQLRQMRADRVRVYGRASTSEPAYGHLGQARAEVSVYRMIYLDPTRPECQ